MSWTWAGVRHGASSAAVCRCVGRWGASFHPSGHGPRRSPARSGAPRPLPWAADDHTGRARAAVRTPARGGRAARAGGGPSRTAVSDDRRHLEAFAESHTGVEAFVEPRTTVTETTVVLVATTGSGPGAGCPSPQVAHDVGQRAGHPVVRRRGRRLPAADAGLDRRSGPRSRSAAATAGTAREPRRHPGAATAPVRRSVGCARSEAPGGEVLGELDERAHGDAGAALGRVAVRPALVVRRPGDVEVRPAPVRARRTRAGRARPTSIPPSRALSTLAMSATCESRPRRSSSGSGIGQAPRRPASPRRAPSRAGRRRWP